MAADLREKVALITGAGGISSAAAALFAAAGARVFVVDRDQQSLDSVGASLPGSRGFQADLTAPGAADRAVQTALDAFGRLDILFNVAGISGRRFGDGPVHEATDAGWDTVMDTNARTVFTMCRAALRPMLASGSGVIVNTASVLAYAPNAEHFATHAYAASKAAIIGLTKAMAAYYAPYGIRVNAVAPGLIATPMSARAQQDPAILGYLRQRQPITGQPGGSGDVAEAVLYLATAPFITGVILEVAGGWSVAG